MSISYSSQIEVERLIWKNQNRIHDLPQIEQFTKQKKNTKKIYVENSLFVINSAQHALSIWLCSMDQRIFWNALNWIYDDLLT